MPIRYKASLAVLLCVPKCVELNLCNPPSANCDQHIHSSIQAQGAEVRNIKPLSISHQASLSMPTHQASLALLVWLRKSARIITLLVYSGHPQAPLHSLYPAKG